MPLKLEVRHLEVVLAIKQQKSLTAAATRLGVTQSALTHRVREAERRLGAKLCERHGKFLALTPSGMRCAAEAEAMLIGLTRLEEEIELNKFGIDHHLKVGSRAYSCYRWLPQFLRDYQEHERRVSVELVDDASGRPLEALQSGQVNVSILSGPAAIRGIRYVNLFRDQLVGILPPDHPRANAAYLGPSDFRDETYVTYSSTPEPGHEWEQFFLRFGFAPKRFVTAGLTEAVIELVHSGFGVSMIASWAARRYAATGYVAAVPITQKGIWVDWRAAYRETAEREPAATGFVRSLAGWCRGNADVIGYLGPVRGVRRGRKIESGARLASARRAEAR